MNNHTLLRFSFTIAEAIASLPIASANIQGRSNAPKNIWDYYAVASYSVSYACRKPRFGIVLYLSNYVLRYFITMLTTLLYIS